MIILQLIQFEIYVKYIINRNQERAFKFLNRYRIVEQALGMDPLFTNLTKYRMITQKYMDKKPSKITLIPQKIVKETNFNSFCSGFFISSFPYKNGKVIAGSKNLMSLCNHIRCSKLEAMEPEIIYKYPLEDTKKLEINNLNASICFPNGIKVCYNQEKENIKIINNFSTKITNQFGERYYMVMFFFYRDFIDNTKTRQNSELN